MVYSTNTTRVPSRVDLKPTFYFVVLCTRVFYFCYK
ncbi:unnamed protein product [Arabidopsis halleri]